MLNFIYYPVSFILWTWHIVFGRLLGDASAGSWALAIVFLVFTLRAILLGPAIKQIRSARTMQQFAPQMKAIKKKYANDRQAQSAALQKLQREHGVRPLGGCLSMILQIPVFIGLNHVLRTFTQHPNQSNYLFPVADVHSYLAARLFDTHLGDAIFNTGLIGRSGHATWAWGVAPVAIPLMIVAAIATHFTARLSVTRTAAASPEVTPQSQLMSRLAMSVFPLGVLVFGGALPVGLLVYWVSYNAWTLAQQHFILKRIAWEDAQKEVRSQQDKRAITPKPGQKPPPRTKTAHLSTQAEHGIRATCQPARDLVDKSGNAKREASPGSTNQTRGNAVSKSLPKSTKH